MSDERAASQTDESPTIGLFNRIISFAPALKGLPPTLSDEEVDGLLMFLPSDTAAAFRFLLKPDIREASLLFINTLIGFFEEVARAKMDGKKVILTAFNFPPEIIHAFDSAVVLTSEVITTFGVMTLQGQGDKYWDYAIGLGLPDHLCSASTIEVGSMLAGAEYAPDAVIISASGSCDANAKVHQFLAYYLGIPQFVIDKVPDDSERGLESFKLGFARLIRELEEFTGEELKEENLRRVAENTNRCTELYYELWELRKHVPSPVPGVFSPFTYGNRFTMWGRPEGVALLEKCIEVSKRNMSEGLCPAGVESARVFWTYVSHYFDVLNFFGWMEEQGISYMGDLVLMCFPRPIPLDSKESILDGMAETAWDMFMTRQMGAEMMSVRWTEDLLYIIRELQVDCCVYCGHHSCKQTWSVFSLVSNEVMKRASVPTLCLYGDSWLKRVTPASMLQEDIKRFMENVVVKGGKKSGVRRSAGQHAGCATER
jgi:benzoyl-CoA reductase/2-hydroxyglutaryl-CoA dehydratase subunit BcrC/BadD/HgdB